MAPVANVKTVADGELVKLGPLLVKAHYTPGHTQGGMSRSWTATEGNKTLNMVYADSLNAFGAGSFRYSGSASYPHAKRDVEQSIARVAALPCDMLVTAHPEASASYADAGRARLAKTLAQEAQKR
ncbi:hypothetical protein ACHAC9_05240 [Massilia sp. CMS3.1]|uniref:hypothetical protein n=1 Tax=Massilia sp. CMS3.1 TaxID=3373083 RepID=UPI003EE722C5